MGSRYVPPHLRRNSCAVNSTEADAGSPSAGDEELPRRRLSDLPSGNDDLSRPLYTIHEIDRHFGSGTNPATVRALGNAVTKLGVITLYSDAGPKWQTERTVYTHSNLFILPGYHEYYKKLHQRIVRDDPPLVINEWTFLGTMDEATFDHQDWLPPSRRTCPNVSESVYFHGENEPLIPVFLQVIPREIPRSFAFEGYFRLERIDFLRPNSPELVRMLRHMWEVPPTNPNEPDAGTKERSHRSWTISMSQEWAVLYLEPVDKSQAPEDPKIEILPYEKRGRPDFEERAYWHSFWD